jgi:hypothetical protein
MMRVAPRTDHKRQIARDDVILSPQAARSLG